MRGLRSEVSEAEQAVRDLEATIAEARARASTLEARRDQLQTDVNRRHTEHSGLSAQLRPPKERASGTASRVDVLDAEHAALGAQGRGAEGRSCVGANETRARPLQPCVCWKDAGPALE